jgi:hypothetical protein
LSESVCEEVRRRIGGTNSHMRIFGPADESTYQYAWMG